MVAVWCIQALWPKRAQREGDAVVFERAVASKEGIDLMKIEYCDR